MKALKKICKGIDTLNDFLGKVFSLIVIGVLVVILIEVFMRRLLNRPQIWTQDLIVMFFACYIILIAAYGFLKGAFVCVDLLFDKLPKRGQYIMHLVTYCIFFVPFVYPMIPKAEAFFVKSFISKETAYSVWAPVLWPEKLCFFIGLTLLGIQGISQILKQIIGIVEGDVVLDFTQEKEEIKEITEEGGEVTC